MALSECGQKVVQAIGRLIEDSRDLRAELAQYMVDTRRPVSIQSFGGQISTTKRVWLKARQGFDHGQGAAEGDWISRSFSAPESGAAEPLGTRLKSGEANTDTLKLVQTDKRFNE